MIMILENEKNITCLCNLGQSCSDGPYLWQGHGSEPRHGYGPMTSSISYHKVIRPSRFKYTGHLTHQATWLIIQMFNVRFMFPLGSLDFNWTSHLFNYLIGTSLFLKLTWLLTKTFAWFDTWIDYPWLMSWLRTLIQI